jgi:hypothetical protein
MDFDVPIITEWNRLAPESAMFVQWLLDRLRRADIELVVVLPHRPAS